MKQYSDSSSKQNKQKQYDEDSLHLEYPDHRYSIAFFIGIIILEISIAVLYGFFMRNTEYNYNGQTDQARIIQNPYKLQFVLTNVLAVLGFGLLMVHHRNAIRQTLFVSLFVAALNLQLSPLFQKLWLNVFITKFKFYANDYTNSDILLIPSAMNKNVTLSFMTISSFCTIALLLALSSVMGRIGIFNLLITTFLFCCGFNLSYFLNYSIMDNFESLSVFDDMQGSRVFCFAAGFGLALIIIYSKIRAIPKKYLNAEQQKALMIEEQKNLINVMRYENNLLVTLFTLLGTGFTFCCFYYILDPFYTFSKQNKDRAYLNYVMSFCANILTCMGMSCLFRGKININFVNYGALSGFIYIAVLATFIKKPFVAMIVGSAGGILTSFGLLLHETTSKGRYMIDPKGFIPVVFCSCIFSSYLAVPIIMRAYEINEKLENNYYNEVRHFIYSSISLGIGFGFGILSGILRKWIKQTPVMTDMTFFSTAFNIFPALSNVTPEDKKKNYQQQNLKRSENIPSKFIGSYAFEDDDGYVTAPADKTENVTAGKFVSEKNSQAIILDFD